LKLVSFDVIGTADIYNNIFKFEAAQEEDESETKDEVETELKPERRLSEKESPTPPINAIFADSGYDTSNFILGMGPLFFVELVYLLIFILLPLSRHIFRDMPEDGHCARTSIWINDINKIESFSLFFRFYLEGAFEICINTLISFRMMSYKSWSTPQLCFANLFMLCNLVILIYLPFKTLGITRKFARLYWTDKQYRNRYNWMFEELRAKKLSSGLFHLFFIIRRYIITLCLVAMPRNTLF
jgi:hypothetical protein